jgi:hypothetical protein
MDLPEVQASTRLEATIPLGDGESLERLRERTEDAVTVRLAPPRCWTRIYRQAASRNPGQDPDDGTQAAAGDAVERWSARPRLARSTATPEVRLAGRSRPGGPWHPGWR